MKNFTVIFQYLMEREKNHHFIKIKAQIRCLSAKQRPTGVMIK